MSFLSKDEFSVRVTKITFAQDLSLENCIFVLIFSTGFTLLNVLLLFPLSITVFIFVHSFLFYFM